MIKCMAFMALGLLAVLGALAFADKAMGARADYQVCAPIHNGPIAPENPKQPFQRQPDAT